MTYYFLSTDPSQLGDYQTRMPVLIDAKFVGDLEAMESELSRHGDAFFFIPIKGIDQKIKNFILSIKEKAPTAKIIYITDDDHAHELKAHQLSPFGGDAYIHHGTRTMDLKEILESLKGPEVPEVENRLEKETKNEFSDLSGLDLMKSHPVSHQIDESFKTVIKEKSKTPKWQSSEGFSEPPLLDSDENGETMSTKDKELSLNEAPELEISLTDEGVSAPAEEEGLSLSLDDGDELSLSDADLSEESQDEGLAFGELSLDEEDSLSLDEASSEEVMENLGELSFDEAAPEAPGEEISLDQSLDLSSDDALSLSDESLDLGQDDDLSLNLDDNESLDLGVETDLSDDAKEKLKEIDAIMDFDASQVAIRSSDILQSKESEEDVLDEPLVSDDLNLDSLNFSSEEPEEIAPAPKEEKPKKKKSKEKDRDLGEDLKELSGAYSGEMERLQATISNLRSDREELLEKIQKLEEEKVLQSRQTLTLRAELDEKKIELTIIRKKLNEEVSDLKDRLKLFDEKRLILEEKNRVLTQELDKAAQKNKIDVKKVQMRERELEQKLELLKADAETQIRNRDLKILELKRKIDAMEFDMESMSSQEKRSVESRYELEDKLEKAIKTLRNAITVLEDESDRSNALDALKKNIDM